MTRRHAFLIAVLTLTLISLTIPESRRVMVMQVRYLAQGRVYPDREALANGWQQLYGRFVESSDVALSDDWETWMARAEFANRVGLSEKAFRKAPDRPETCASAIVAHCLRRWWTLGEVTAPYQHVTDREMDPELGQTLLRLSRHGASLDPSNAYFDLVSAYALFGLHRDTEALRMFHTAAHKPRFESYRRIAIRSAVGYLDAAGMPIMETGAFPPAALHPDLSVIGQVSCVSVANARLIAAEGRGSEAKSLLWDVIAVGKLLRQSDQVACRATGAAIQTQVTEFEPKLASLISPGKPMDYEAAKMWRAQLLTAEFASRGWRDLAELWALESAAGLQYHLDVPREGVLNVERRLVLAMTGTYLASCSLRMAGIIGAVWIVLSALVGLCRRDMRQPTAGRAWRIGLIVGSLVPWVALAVAHAPYSFPCPGMTANSLAGLSPVSAEVVLSLLAAGLVLSTAVGTLAAWMRSASRWMAGPVAVLLLTGTAIACWQFGWYVSDVLEGLGNPYVILGLVALALITMRTVYLRRRDPACRVGSTVLGTAHLAARLLACTFVLVYFTVLLGHLFLRHEVVKELRPVLKQEIGWTLSYWK